MQSHSSSKQILLHTIRSVILQPNWWNKCRKQECNIMWLILILSIKERKVLYIAGGKKKNCPLKVEDRNAENLFPHHALERAIKTSYAFIIFFTENKVVFQEVFVALVLLDFLLCFVLISVVVIWIFWRNNFSSLNSDYLQAWNFWQWSKTADYLKQNARCITPMSGQ